jgi:hypothetical protein
MIGLTKQRSVEWRCRALARYTVVSRVSGYWIADLVFRRMQQWKRRNRIVN